MIRLYKFLSVCCIAFLSTGALGKFSRKAEPMHGNTEREFQARLSQLERDQSLTSGIGHSRSDESQLDSVKLKGGDYASENIAKFIAYIRVTFQSRHPVPCTGTFFSDDMVLTAAECFEGEAAKFDVSETLVRVGQVNQTQRWYSAKEIRMMDNYDPDTMFNNVAMIILSEKIREPIGIVRIPPPHFVIRNGSLMSTAEFERKCPLGQAEFRVRSVELRYENISTCESSWRAQGNDNWDSEQIICARKTNTSNTDSGSICLERAGAPLYRIDNNSGIVQYGISSSIRSTVCRGIGRVQWFTNLKTHKLSILKWKRVFDVDNLPPRVPIYP